MKKIINKTMILAGIMSVISASAMASGAEEKYIDATGTLGGLIHVISQEAKFKLDMLSKENQEKFLQFQKNINNKLKTQSLNQNVFFKTDDHKLDEKTKNYLTNVLFSIDDHESLVINVAGFSDSRGSEKHNMELSKKRAETIYNFFVSSGVKKENLTLAYFGEKFAEKNLTTEEYFFDRKVTITFRKK